MNRWTPGLPTSLWRSSPSPCLSSTLCIQLYVTKAKGSPPGFDRALREPFAAVPRSRTGSWQFLRGGATAQSALGTVGCRQVLLSWALSPAGTAGDTSQSPTAEVMSCPSSAGVFLISWVCQVLRAPCTVFFCGCHAEHQSCTASTRPCNAQNSLIYFVLYSDTVTLWFILPGLDTGLF